MTDTPKEGMFDGEPQQTGEEVEVQLAGPIVKLSHPEIGHTFVLDVTDLPDPTTGDSSTSIGAWFTGMMRNPAEEGYLYNNGLFAVRTGKFQRQPDPERTTPQPRIYLGIDKVSQGPAGYPIEVTEALLTKAGFGPLRDGTIPFSSEGYAYGMKLLKDALLKYAPDRDVAGFLEEPDS